MLCPLGPLGSSPTSTALLSGGSHACGSAPWFQEVPSLQLLDISVWPVGMQVMVPSTQLYWVLVLAFEIEVEASVLPQGVYTLGLWWERQSQWPLNCLQGYFSLVLKNICGQISLWSGAVEFKNFDSFFFFHFILLSLFPLVQMDSVFAGIIPSLFLAPVEVAD